MIIYGSSFSPFVRKLLAYCEERGLEFTLKSVAIGDPDPGFRKASPLKKMPAIDDDGYLLADSSAIIHYLEAKHGPSGLIPEQAQDRGRTIWFEEYADTVMARCIGAMFFNRIVAPKFLNQPGDQDAADKAEAEEWPAICDYLQSELQHGHDWLVGNNFSLADIAVVSALHNLEHAGAKICEDHEAVQRYYDRTKMRPSFTKWTTKEFAILAG